MFKPLTFRFKQGASGAVMAVIAIALALVMVRWSRRQKYLYHNRELEELVSSLQYRKRNTDAELASMDSDESDVSAWASCPSARTVRHLTGLITGSRISVTAPRPCVAALSIP